MSNLALNQNQTFQTPILGQVTMDPQPGTVSVLLNPASVAPVITAGQSVKLIAGAGKQILVDVCSSPLDVVYGIIAYNMRKNIHKAGDVVTCVGVGGIVILKASAIIPRGGKVATTNQLVLTDDPTVALNVVAANGMTGIALDQAAGPDDLIRVQIAPSVNP